MDVKFSCRNSILGFLFSVAAAAFATIVPISAQADAERWDAIKTSLVGDKVVQDGTNIISIEAPDRAHDAATVPITLTALIPQSEQRYIKTMHLIADKNPAPLAGTFHFKPNHGWATIQTRIRINEYTDVRVLAETNDGDLYMNTVFVKAAGGCSAPALSDLDATMAKLGKLKLKLDEAMRPGEPTVAQILINHPNNSGMQFDQVSRNYIPAHFVHKIGVFYNGEEILTVDTNFSMSENPSLHFSFIPEEEGEVTVYAVDSKENRFEKSWPVNANKS